MRNFFQPRNQLIPQRGNPHPFAVAIGHRFLQRRAQPDDARKIFRTRAFAAFLRAAFDEADKRVYFTEIQSAHSLGPVKFMRGKGQRVDTFRLYVDIEMPRRLYRVRMEGHAARPTNPSDLADRLNRPDLVIRIHDRDKRRVGTDRRLHLGGPPQPVLMYGQKRHLKAPRFQFLQSMQYGVMLEGRGNNMLFPLSFAQRRQRQKRLVVRLASARGKINFPRLAPKGRRHESAHLFQLLLRPLPKRIKGGGVSVFLFQIRQHSGQCGVAHARRGRIICVNRHLFRIVCANLLFRIVCANRHLVHFLTPFAFLLCAFLSKNLIPTCCIGF